MQFAYVHMLAEEAAGKRVQDIDMVVPPLYVHCSLSAT
jgi:hypothetical protein